MSRFLFPRQFFYVSMVKNCGSLARDWYGDLLKIGDFQLTDTDFKQKNQRRKSTLPFLNRGPTIREIFWGCRFFFFGG